MMEDIEDIKIGNIHNKVRDIGLQEISEIYLNNQVISDKMLGPSYRQLEKL